MYDGIVTCRSALHDIFEVIVEHILFVIATGQEWSIGADDSHVPSAGEREPKLHEAFIDDRGR